MATNMAAYIGSLIDIAINNITATAVPVVVVVARIDDVTLDNRISADEQVETRSGERRGDERAVDVRHSSTFGFLDGSVARSFATVKTL